MKEAPQKIIEIFLRLKQNLVFTLIFAVFVGAAFFFAYQTFIPAFAVGTFSDDFSTIDAMDATTGWTAQGTNAAISLKNDFQTEGTGMIQATCGNSVCAGEVGMTKNFSIDVSNKQFWYYLFAGTSQEGSWKDLISNARIVLYNGAGRTGNSATWNACTSDCSTKLSFGTNKIKFYTTQPDSVSGAFNA